MALDLKVILTLDRKKRVYSRNALSFPILLNFLTISKVIPSKVAHQIHIKMKTSFVFKIILKTKCDFCKRGHSCYIKVCFRLAIVFQHNWKCLMNFIFSEFLILVKEYIAYCKKLVGFGLYTFILNSIRIDFSNESRSYSVFRQQT